ncbi:unnamed protein product [Pedinophyceae sp. YPF-701]|nr:unnamed protein product [Pedinophyceae sp. YPF-701]
MVAEGLTSITPDGDTLRVREVWSDNLDQEFEIIRDVVDRYPYLAMDTEFPGVVVKPVGNFRTNGEFTYAKLRTNVDLLKIIQLGLTFTDDKGNLPVHDGELCAWQFNFREFKLSEDLYASDSIDLLRESGIDFDEINRRGIEVKRFAELLMTSGIVLNANIRWVTFHSSYDFGYLLKLLTCDNLPEQESDFFELFHIFFPTVYDIKYLMKFCGNLHGGLNRLAEQLEVGRIGPQHQAGSDSLLTATAFTKLVADYFTSGDGDDILTVHRGVLYGLGSDASSDLYRDE